MSRFLNEQYRAVEAYTPGEQTRDMQNKVGGYTLGQELALTVKKTVTESGNTPTTTKPQGTMAQIYF